MMIGIFILLFVVNWGSQEIEETSVEASHSQGARALDLGSSNGHITVVKFLLKGNADIESMDNKYRWTPLSWAAEKGHVDVVELLLNANANIEAADKYGRTPLSWAAEKGHVDVHGFKPASVTSTITPSTDPCNGLFPPCFLNTMYDKWIYLLQRERADIRASCSKGQHRATDV